MQKRPGSRPSPLRLAPTPRLGPRSVLQQPKRPSQPSDYVSAPHAITKSHRTKPAAGQTCRSHQLGCRATPGREGPTHRGPVSLTSADRLKLRRRVAAGEGFEEAAAAVRCSNKVVLASRRELDLSRQRVKDRLVRAWLVRCVVSLARSRRSPGGCRGRWGRRSRVRRCRDNSACNSRCCPSRHRTRSWCGCTGRTRR